jgi:ribonucleotide reductase beta subunit family protein with ferritin-like domain
MKGLIMSNKFIARDESLHQIFGCTMYSYIKNKLSQEEVDSIFIEAIDIAIEFANETIKYDIINMNKEDMITYIKFNADRLLFDLGYKQLYNVKNPFKFIESISLNSKGNFFETRLDSYQTIHSNNLEEIVSLK